ncbi:unnamed protein product [Hydatigera taeniaeformis]|uniref:C2H2-type domain-containing protein n=1 Tax=Hydatigena taeniaeformis TaxID=6205 RepID=A0A0R3WNU3_HYDTA|nr:unnamed protein product [Hydatigera taeniaeformis]
MSFHQHRQYFQYHENGTPLKESATHSFLTTNYLSSSSSSSWQSSSLSTNCGTLSAEPLDLRINDKCRHRDGSGVNSSAILLLNLFKANALFGGLIKRFKEEAINRDVSSEESSDESESIPSVISFEKKRGKEGGGKAAQIHYRPEKLGSREMVQEMLRNKDPELRYINDGEAIMNPFAVDRKTQLADLMKMFCREKASGGYKCEACGRERQLIREMQQHLLCHSNSKFYLCVRCLKGFNDTFDMKRHTRKHTKGHLKRVHAMQLHFARHQRREVLRVCECCGFTCDHYAQLLAHTEYHHPSNQDAINRLRKRIIAAKRNGV